MNLDDLKQIAELDKENMLDLLMRFPKQCEDALFIGEHTKIKDAYKRSYSHIVFIGVGGSAIGGDIVKDYVDGEIGTPIFVNRDYKVPAFVNKNTLIFASSYSGNTEETLSAYADARKKGAKIIAITSDGRLKDLALRNRDMLIKIPKGYPPRCALGYSVIPATVALSKLGLIKDKKREIKAAVQLLDNLGRKKLAPSVREKANMSKGLARRLYNRFAAIYSSNEMGSVATRWREQFGENSKTLSSTHVFPEMNHNEITGWVYPKGLLKGFTAIMLKDKGDHPRLKKRISITASILKRAKFTVLEVESQGKALFERMLSLIYIGDFVSFYLAILNRVDPTPVERIVYLKKQLVK